MRHSPEVASPEFFVEIEWEAAKINVVRQRDATHRNATRVSVAHLNGPLPVFWKRALFCPPVTSDGIVSQIRPQLYARKPTVTV